MTRLSIILATVLISLSGFAQAETTRLAQLQNCVPGASAEQRQRCDDAVSEQLRSTSRTTQLDQGWRLVTTTEPGGRGETVSVMHAADSTKSDLGLAGLSLRCGQSGGVEILLILLAPVPRTSPPKVALVAGGDRKEFETTVAPSSEALLLPPTASVLPAGNWLNAGELSVEIMTGSNPIRGIVPIGGLQAALRALAPHCAIR
ncbi:hypothetical protein QCM80_40395 [Bradyrhizobium sp. SSUT112]|uniref:hypothetical protein n=1 Tax=Bradyrhizobium sp. SSUT112 TaxID=3040604 RepID=UPI00244C5254|nr:hypothetical protein [Bradyrhizobium sp. SSUT112]MDH2356832.1 hypothetical protein [Bradyrhizobium sp. SSUT112]